MKLLSTRYISLGLIFSILFLASCSKDDPAPLGSQVNAKLLAGESGKSKSWKMREFNFKNSSGSGTASFNGCFTDNVYTFTNNASQDYAATEGLSKCSSGSSDTIETGTWAFTTDGLVINIMVDETKSSNGLFSTDLYFATDEDGNLVNAFTAGYITFPAFVVKLDENNMVLEVNVTGEDGSSFTYTLTFTPA